MGKACKGERKKADRQTEIEKRGNIKRVRERETCISGALHVTLP